MSSKASSSNKILLIRCGGKHSAVVWDSCRELYVATGVKIVIWDDNGQAHKTLPQSHIVQDIESVLEILSKEQNITTIDCLVCVGSPTVRKKLVDEIEVQLKNRYNVEFPNVIHKTATVSMSATLGNGCYVGAGSLINVSASVGSFCIINSHAIIEHDCTLHDYATINPGAILCGTVSIGHSTVVGANATVREQCDIPSNVIVGMGSSVVKSITEANSLWMGVPARIRKAKVSPEDTRNIRWCPIKPMNFKLFQTYLEPSVLSNRVTNDGPLLKVLSTKLKTFTSSTKSILLAANGTAALHALVAAYTLKLGRPLRWATQGFTFPPSIQGPLCEAIILDMDEVAWGPCFIALERMKHEIDGVIVTNVFGYQTKILKYENWCKDNKKVLLFDNAATPVGFVTDGRAVVDIGDGSIISLHETKPIGRGEGGAVFVSAEMAVYVHRAMNFGFDIPNNVRVGSRQSSNWRMCDIAAAAICCHLDRITSAAWQAKYNSLLQGSLEVIRSRKLNFGAFFAPPTLISCLFLEVPKEGHGKVDVLCHALYNHTPSYEAKHYYLPLDSRLKLPKSWELYDRHICLPFHVDTSIEEVTNMIDTLLSLC